MAYEKTQWKDRVVEKPRTYTMQNNPDGTVTLIPAFGAITEEGTPVTAANMNKLETQYDEAVSEAQAKVDTHANETTTAHGGVVPSSDVVTTATGNKLLKLNSSAKLPASITGDAATVGGKTVGNANGNIPLSNGVVCTNLDADKVDGKHASDFILKSEGLNVTAYTVDRKGGAKASLPEKRKEFFIGVINNIIYVAGGTNGSSAANTTYAYNPSTDTWTTKANMPANTQSGAYAVVNNILYTLGAGTPSTTSYNKVYAYDPSNNTWSTKTGAPVNRGHACAETVGGIIYVFAGSSSSRFSADNATYAYNPSTDTWTAKASMPSARCSAACSVINNIIYVIGGVLDSSSNNSNANEAYNPSSNTWAVKANMPSARRELGCGALGGQIYAIGGYNGSQIVDVTEVYDVATNTWTVLSTGRGRRGMGVTVIGSVLYAIGGGASSSSDVYKANMTFTAPQYFSHPKNGIVQYDDSPLQIYKANTVVPYEEWEQATHTITILS